MNAMRRGCVETQAEVPSRCVRFGHLRKRLSSEMRERSFQAFSAETMPSREFSHSLRTYRTSENATLSVALREMLMKVLSIGAAQHAASGHLCSVKCCWPEPGFGRLRIASRSFFQLCAPNKKPAPFPVRALSFPRWSLLQSRVAAKSPSEKDDLRLAPPVSQLKSVT
jgi:hypothetical protein